MFGRMNSALNTCVPRDMTNVLIAFAARTYTQKLLMHQSWMEQVHMCLQRARTPSYSAAHKHTRRHFLLLFPRRHVSTAFIKQQIKIYGQSTATRDIAVALLLLLLELTFLNLIFIIQQLSLMP